MKLEDKKKLWRNASSILVVLLLAMFILLFYSLTVLNGCLEKSIYDEMVTRGVCTVPGLRSAAKYNWVLILAIIIASIGLIVSVIRIDRINRKIDRDNEEEPPVEVRSNDAYLPNVEQGVSSNKSKNK